MDRNYKLIDLDNLLRRQENPKSWIFPAFATDVFTKRLTLAGYETPGNVASMDRAFGDGPTPSTRAKLLVGSTPRNAVKVEQFWPENVRDKLLEMAESDPLGARLTEAWIRQKSKRDYKGEFEVDDILDWKKKQWWKKERTEQALIQIAGRCRRQRMLWSGVEDVLQLSGGNILVFMSICQHIWGAWLRAESASDNPQETPHIDDDVQALGVHEASTHWFNKLPEERNGNTRQRFISFVANLLERKMIDGTKVQVLKTYDRSYAREVFNGIGDEALKSLAEALEITAKFEAADIPDPEGPEYQDFLWEELCDAALEDARQSPRLYSFFVVTETKAGNAKDLYVSAEWPSAEEFARDRLVDVA